MRLIVMNNSKYLLLSKFIYSKLLILIIFPTCFLFAMEPMKLQHSRKIQLVNLPFDITRDILLFKLVNTGNSLEETIRNIKAYLLTSTHFCHMLNESNVGDLIAALADRWTEGELGLIKSAFEAIWEFEKPTKQKASERIRDLVNSWYKNYSDFLNAIRNRDFDKIQTFMPRIPQYIIMYIATIELDANGTGEILDFFIAAAKLKPEIKEIVINRNELKIAIDQGNISKVKELLAKRADVNADDLFHTVPLVRAVKRRNQNIIELLLGAGAGVNKKDFRGQTSLIALLGSLTEECYWYQIEFDFTIIDLLIKAGVEINEQDNNGDTALMHAIRQHYKCYVKKLLEYNPDLNIKNHKGQSALDIAQQMNYPAVIELLNEKIQQNMN